MAMAKSIVVGMLLAGMSLLLGFYILRSMHGGNDYSPNGAYASAARAPTPSRSPPDFVWASNA